MTDRKSQFPVILGCNALREIFQSGDKPKDDDRSLVHQAPQMYADGTKKASSKMAAPTKDESMPLLTVRRVQCKIEGEEWGFGTDVLGKALKSPSGSVDSYGDRIKVRAQDLGVVVANQSKERKLIPQVTVIASATGIESKRNVIILESDGVPEAGVMDTGMEMGSQIEVDEKSQSIQESIRPSNDEYTDGTRLKLPIEVKLHHIVERETDTFGRDVHNITHDRATWCFPYQLMFGREPSIPIDQLLGA